VSTLRTPDYENYHGRCKTSYGETRVRHNPLKRLLMAETKSGWCICILVFVLIILLVAVILT